MATVTQRRVERRFLLEDVSWQFYEACLAEIGDRPIRISYDRGRLELMSPTEEHERWKKLLGRLIEVATEELDIPIRSGGSTTWRKEDLKRGLEPDECYYIQHEAQLRGRDEIDLAVDPPPDLAIEVEYSASAVDRLGIYAALGVPEVWRFDGDRLTILCLGGDGQYHVRADSPSLPDLPPAEVERFMAARNETDETTWVRSFRRWVQENLGSDDSHAP